MIKTLGNIISNSEYRPRSLPHRPSSPKHAEITQADIAKVRDHQAPLSQADRKTFCGPRKHFNTDKEEEYSDKCCNVVVKLIKQEYALPPAPVIITTLLSNLSFARSIIELASSACVKPRIHSQAVC